MKGLQDAGVMACAKHFPGHGDVSVDSHVDLPVINKTLKQLDTVELYPFKKLINEGIAGVMVAHLYVPDIDKTPNLATSISKKSVTKLLRKKLKFDGLTFTDALEMKGVAKYFPGGEAAVQALIAGNDLLSLPGNIDTTIMKIRQAVAAKKIRWKEINAHVKKVLLAKYQYGLANLAPVNLSHLTEDLNEGVPEMRKDIAENAITLLRNRGAALYPLNPVTKKRVAYVGLG